MAGTRATPESPAEKAVKTSSGVTTAGSDEASMKKANEAHSKASPGRTKGGAGSMGEVAGGDQKDKGS